MADKMLKELIAGRNVNNLKCSEAVKIVKEFWMRWTLLTLSQRNQDKTDFFAKKALKKAGLGAFI